MSFRSSFLTLSYVCLSSACLALASPDPATRKVSNNTENKAADLAMHGYMRQHFRAGMRHFFADEYEKAAPELLAATMIPDPFISAYWYAEAYANLGVIYEFHMKSPDHRQKAYEFYSLALKRDPRTLTARYYIRGVRPRRKDPRTAQVPQTAVQK